MRCAAHGQTAIVLAVLLATSTGSVIAGPITYVLQPGSTFTPCSGSVAIGPAEDLTGTFTWLMTTPYVYQCTALQFQSASFSFTLDTQYPGNSVVDGGNSTVYFNHVLDVTGLWASPVTTSSGWQPFQGTPDNPTSLNLPGMGLAPAPNGGLWAGRMTLIAIQQVQSLPGDANQDGVVDISDLNKVLTNYNQSGMKWADGDFDSNGSVDLSDLNKVLTNYNKTAAASDGLRPVPEPSALVLTAAVATGLLYLFPRKG